MKQNCPKRGNAPRMGLALSLSHARTQAHAKHSHAGQTRARAPLPDLNDSVCFLSLAMCVCISAADWHPCKSCPALFLQPLQVCDLSECWILPSWFGLLVLIT